MRLILELSLPIIIVLVAIYFLRTYLTLKRPSPLALGCIIPKLCAVRSEEILRYNEVNEDDSRVASHLRREVLWMQSRVNSGYLREMAWNTTLFQCALRFEKMKIDPSKSALKYEPRETLVSELVNEAAVMRWQLFRWQVSLLSQATLRLSMNQQVLITLLAQYKHLEQEMVTLASMADDDCFHKMLIERLGLTNWNLYEGNSPTPA